MAVTHTRTQGLPPGTALRADRQNSGLTMPQAAQLCGWSKEVWRAIERGEVRLAMRGGTIGQRGPRDASYELLHAILAAHRAGGGELPTVDRWAARRAERNGEGIDTEGEDDA